MTVSEKYAYMRAYARVSGGKLGVLWIVSFALFVCSFRYPFCGFLWIATLVFTPFYVAMLTDSYSQKLPEKCISYRHAYAHSFLTVFYASLIMAICQWAYFQFHVVSYRQGKHEDDGSTWIHEKHDTPNNRHASFTPPHRHGVAIIVDQCDGRIFHKSHHRLVCEFPTPLIIEQ